MVHSRCWRCPSRFPATKYAAIAWRRRAVVSGYAALGIAHALKEIASTARMLWLAAPTSASLTRPWRRRCPAMARANQTSTRLDSDQRESRSCRWLAWILRVVPEYLDEEGEPLRNQSVTSGSLEGGRAPGASAG